MNTPEPTRTWSRLLSFTFIFALVFLRFANHSIIFRDSFIFYAPNKYLVSEALKQGTIWAWYPWQYMGMPFVADFQAGWFYPLNFLYVVLPFELGHRLFILIHYLLAAIFMDLFLRGRGLDRKACLLGALAFALSGYMIGQHSMVRMLIGAAWMPLALYCMDRALDKGIAWAIGAGAVLAIQVFGGDPLTAGITAAIITLFGLIGALKPGRRVLALVSIFAVALSSIAFCAVQLLPTYELMLHSFRGGGVSLDEATKFSFHPARLIEIVWPTPFGTYWPRFNYWAEFVMGKYINLFSIPFSMSNYMGLPLVVLAVIGIVRGRGRWKAGAGVGAVFFLLLALGYYTPVYAWVHRSVPGFNLFRYPAKYMAWFSFFMAVAGALGFEKVHYWCVQKPSAVARGAMVYMAAILAGAGVVALAWPAVVDLVSNLTPDEKALKFALSHLIDGGRQLLIVNLVVGFLFFLIGRKIFSVNRGLLIVFFVLIFDWWLTNVTIMPSGPADIFDFKPLAAQAIHPRGRPPLGEYRIFREGMEYQNTNPALFPYVPYERTRIWDRTTMTRNLQAMEGFEDIVGYGSTHMKDGAFLLRRKLSGDLMELYNVRYIISNSDREPIESVRTELILNEPINDVAIIRLPDAWPRAYWVPSAKAAADESQAMQMLFSSDLRRTVILITAENIEADDPGDLKMTPATITNYEPDRVDIETNVDASGWLVLSDRFYPGWSARVDGRPAKIYKANVLVRAVRLGPGKHKIDFRFAPRSLAIGAAISVPAWMAALSWWALAWWRQRRSLRAKAPGLSRN